MSKLTKREQLEAELFVAKQMGKKLERLQKKVVDAEADYRRYKAAADLWNVAGADDDVIESAAAYDAYHAAAAAYDAWVKVKLELVKYLKEQDDNG